MNTLFYYYRPPLTPFRSVMEMPDEQIVAFMRNHLSEDKIFHANPSGYLRRRRETEAWLYRTFCEKGGKPTTHLPIYMTLGPASYIEAMGLYSGKIEIPLDLFSSTTISFTYPDSYVSRILAETRTDKFNPKFHGQLFSLSKLNSLLEDESVHNDAWREKDQESDFFIEAQIWDMEPLRKFMEGQPPA